MDLANAPSRAIGEMAATLRLGDVPTAVVERAKLHILDALGLALAASVQDFGLSALAGVCAMGTSGNCSVIGRSERLDMRDAALVNGVLIHGLDFDDTHLASIIHATQRPGRVEQRAPCWPVRIAPSSAERSNRSRERLRRVKTS